MEFPASEVFGAIALCHANGQLGWHQPSHALLWHDIDYRIVPCCDQRLFYSWLSYQKKAARVPAKPSFGITSTKT